MTQGFCRGGHTWGHSSGTANLVTRQARDILRCSGAALGSRQRFSVLGVRSSPEQGFNSIN